MEAQAKMIMRYGLALMVGMTLIVYGIIDRVGAFYAEKPMTDEQVIERAKELGMIEVKEAWIKEKAGSSEK